MTAEQTKQKVLEVWPDAVNTLVSDRMIKVWSSNPHGGYSWIELGVGKDVYAIRARREQVEHAHIK